MFKYYWERYEPNYDKRKANKSRSLKNKLSLCYILIVRSNNTQQKATQVYEHTHTDTHTLTHTHIYIYIYIYINKLISITYIYLIHGISTATPGFHGFFFKTTIIRQLRKWNESKIEKILSENRWDFVGMFTRDCECVSVCVCVCSYACVGYCCVLMCVYMGVSEGTNAARCFNRIYIRRCILNFCYIILSQYVCVWL